jgi:hypothetical protein
VQSKKIDNLGEMILKVRESMVSALFYSLAAGCVIRHCLAVELASMLLLAGLVVAFHVGREERAGEVLSNRKEDSAKRKTEEHA